MKRDISNNLKVQEGLAPQDGLNSNTNGAAFEKAAGRGYESVMHAVHLGASGDTLSGSVYIDLVLQESDDDITYNDCSNDDIEVPDAANKGAAGEGIFQRVDDPAEDEAVYKAGYKGHKRYSRVRLEFTGTHTNGIPVSVLAVGGNALGEPAD